jgi:hypothetical protein
MDQKKSTEVPFFWSRLKGWAAVRNECCQLLLRRLAAAVNKPIPAKAIM